MGLVSKRIRPAPTEPASEFLELVDVQYLAIGWDGLCDMFSQLNLISNVNSVHPIGPNNIDFDGVSLVGALGIVRRSRTCSLVLRST